MARGADAVKSAGAIRALLRKDRLVFLPRFRGGVALVFVLAALQTIRSDEVFLWLGVILAAALAVFVPTVEWRRDTDRLIGSLPVSRGQVVAARYLATVLACAVAWAAWVGAGAALTPLLDAGRPAPAVWATASGALTFFGLAGLLLAAFLPAYFRFGLGRAALGFLPIALILVLAARRLALGSVPDVLLVETAPPPFVPPAMAVSAAFGRLLDGGGFGGGVVAIIALAGLLSVSAWVSLRAFRHRGL